MSRINFREGMFLGKEELQRLQDFQSELPKSLQNLFVKDSESNDPTSFNCVFPLSSHHVELKKVTTELGVSGVLLYHKFGDLKYFVVGRYQTRNCLVGKNSEVIGINGFCPTSSIVNAGVNKVYLNLYSDESSYEDALISISDSGECTFIGWSRIVDCLRQGVTGRYTRIQLFNGKTYSIQSFDEATQTAQLVGEEGSFAAVSKILFKFLPTQSPFSESVNEPLYIYERSSLKPANYPNPYTVGYCEVEDGQIVNVVLEPQSMALPLAPQSIKTGHIADEAVTTVKIADKSITMSKIADEVNLLGDGSVTTAKLAENAVTKSKLDLVVRNRIASSMLSYSGSFDVDKSGSAAPVSGLLLCKITGGRFYEDTEIDGSSITYEDQWIWSPPTFQSVTWFETTGDSAEAGIFFYCDWSGTKTFKRQHIFRKSFLQGMCKIFWPESVGATISLEGGQYYYLHYRRLQWMVGSSSNDTDKIIIDHFSKMNMVE